MRILEALCVSQGWDVAIKWEVDAEEKRLEFGTAWGAPGRRAEALIQESMGMTLAGRQRTARARLEGWPPGLDRRPGPGFAQARAWQPP